MYYQAAQFCPLLSCTSRPTNNVLTDEHAVQRHNLITLTVRRDPEITMFKNKHSTL